MPKSRPKHVNVVIVPTPTARAVEVLADAMDRAAAGETLAVAVIEIRREGVISQTCSGDEDGFRHHLVAGAQYLLTDLLSD